MTELDEIKHLLTEFENRFMAEIERINLEIWEINKRITTLESIVIGNDKKPLLENYIDPHAGTLEKRAQKLLEYVERYGSITTKQAMRHLQVRHREEARRAMELVSNRIEDMEIGKTSSGMWYLKYVRTNVRLKEQGNIHVPLNIRKWPESGPKND